MLNFEPRQAAQLLLLAAQRAGHLRVLGDLPGHEFHGNQWTAGTVSKTELDERFPVVGKQVDGREVLHSVPNVNSIDSSLTDYEVLPGIREVQITDFEDHENPRFYSKSEQERTERLAEKIKSSGQISPLIVVVDKDKRGPYILEGGHRFDALKMIGAKSFPALIVVDTEELEILGDYEGHPFHGNQWTHGGLEEWKKGDVEEGAILNGVPLRTDPHPDFSKSLDFSFEEPDLVVPHGKHGAAGIVVTEPDGRVWVVEPHNRYGGYRNTFPKGTIDKGEDFQETAARELWEETGLVAKITGHLIDVERTTSVTRFYTGVRIGGAPWAAGKETHAVKLLPIHGKNSVNDLKNVRGKMTSDHTVLDALREHMKRRNLGGPGSGDVEGHPFHGNQWTSGWPEGLKNISGAKGSNPGGLYKDAAGNKWYVKRYNDPRQAQTEHIANEVYRAVGVDAPISVLGEGGDYASKIIPGDGTLAHVGITKERANRILDGFAADVFLDNWDAVGTGHDNILVSGNKVTRIDQGGTLLFRAQGALKPESGLEKIDEWNSLVEKNHYYNQIFKAAGIKNGDALGERAVQQIDRIVEARPAKGWKELVDRAAPKASPEFRAKVARVLEKRQQLLEKKRDELRARAAEWDESKHELRARAAEWDESKHPRVPAGGPDGGEFTSGPGGSGGEKKKKAPKAAPVPLESKKAAYDEVKKGGTFKATAAKYGMTQGQLAGYVWKVDQAKKKLEEGLEEELAAKSVIKAKDVVPELKPEPAKPTKTWSEMTQDEKMSYVHQQGYEWKVKPNSTHGNHAWFDSDGVQVSAFGPKDAYREKLDTINYGNGPIPKGPKPDEKAPEAGEWPILGTVERKMSSAFSTEMHKKHEPWTKKLTSQEIDAIGNYTGSGYGGLNAELRTGTLSSYHKTVADRLNSAIDKAPTPPPPDLVWRGISSGNASKLFVNLKNGDQLNLKGFQSTSIKPSFAHSWAGGNVIFEIKPSKGAYVKLKSGHPHEYEYLLPHNAKYTVRGISYVKFEGVSSKVRVLQLEMH